MTRPVLEVAAVAVVLMLSACSETPTAVCLPEVDPTCETPPNLEDDVVAGVNLTALFAPPTPAEIDSARTDVPTVPTAASRTLTALAPADGARRFVLALDDSLGRRIVTALVRVPGLEGDTSPLRTVIVLPEANDASTNDLLTEPGWGAIATNTVQVVLAYRGGALTLEDGPRVSDVEADPYRADIADVLALVRALEDVPRVDLDRVGFVGLGRGGTVALLAAPAARIGAVVTLGAPTDVFAPSFVSDVRERLLGRDIPTPYPGFEALARPAFDVRTGLALEDARRSLLAVSPSKLGRQLPQVLALHAADDQFVGEDQLTSLRLALLNGPGPAGVTQFIEGATHGDLARRPAAQSSAASFLTNAL